MTGSPGGLFRPIDTHGSLAVQKTPLYIQCIYTDKVSYEISYIKVGK